MVYRIEVDKDACIGCGVCEATCPDVFKMGDDGKSELLQVRLEDVGCAEEAAQNCPVECIKISEE